MRSLDWKLLRSVVALSLPTAVVCALSVYFFVDRVPEIEKAERNRVRSEYREVALELRQNPDDGRYMREESLPEVWKGSAAGKMAPGRWGYEPIWPKGFAWVWYDGGKGVAYTKTPIVRERDYRTLFLSFGSLFLLVLVGMTVFGIRYFVDYVRARDDFLAATAHDLTTPLVGMRMSIGRCDLDAKVMNERLIRIVENIKDFMRLGGRRRDPQLFAFDVLRAYDEAYALFRDDYRDLFGGNDVPVEAEGELPNVLADETMTVQMMWNLLGNDLKYAAPYGPVRVRFFAEGRFVKAEFIDEGQGMTPRQMRRAFDRYYRAKTVLESGKGGFGIGLCTSREFARAMGGDLAVRANSPRGCVFTLSLPAAPAAGGCGQESGCTAT